jgi:hypothetical protein
LPPQIDPQQHQGGPGHSRFKELGQDQQEDEPQERQQREELASEAIGNKDGENGNNVEQRGEKRQHQDETKEISSGIHHSEDGLHTHNISNEDNEGLRPAKRRRKLSSDPIEALPPLRDHGINIPLKRRQSFTLLLAKELEIDECHLRLRGICTRQLAGRKTKTAQYRVVCGEYLNRYHAWVDEDDMRMSIPGPLGEPFG